MTPKRLHNYWRVLSYNSHKTYNPELLNIVYHYHLNKIFKHNYLNIELIIVVFLSNLNFEYFEFVCTLHYHKFMSQKIPRGCSLMQQTGNNSSISTSHWYWMANRKLTWYIGGCSPLKTLLHYSAGLRQKDFQRCSSLLKRCIN